MKLKRILGLLSTFACVGLFSVCAYAGTMTVKGEAGSAGDTVEVNVYISPSTDGVSETLNAFTVNLAYDNTVLTPVATGTDIMGDALYATAASSISSGILVATSDETAVAVGWGAASAITYSEKTLLFTVSFTIADSAAAGSSSLSLTVTQLATDPETIVDDSTEYTGEVTVTDSSFLRGDANDDETVDVSDVNIISQYLVDIVASDELNMDQADANDDTYVDVSDVNMLSQYLIGLVTLPD